MSKRAAWTLIALCAWSLWVWTTRVFIIAGQDQSMGFKVVHGILAAGSIAFGLAAGWIGYRGLRAAKSGSASIESADQEMADREVSASR
jgi:type VI protein secretion system component VasK